MTENKNKRSTSVTVDLLEYKDDWIEWCKNNGLTNSQAIRLLVARVLNGSDDGDRKKVLDNTPDRKKVRKCVWLTSSELAAVEKLCLHEGFSLQNWIIALVRHRLTSNAQFGESELKLLASSNLQLLKISRGLNQISNAIKNTGNSEQIPCIDMIDQLNDAIKKHTVSVSSVMSSNIERWKIDNE